MCFFLFSMVFCGFSEKKNMKNHRKQKFSAEQKLTPAPRLAPHRGPRAPARCGGSAPRGSAGATSAWPGEIESSHGNI